MPCQIGITTNPEKRKSAWERERPNLKGWKIMKKCRSKQSAQDEEDRLAKLHRCNAHHGGQDAPGPWYVYKFNY